MATILVTGGCGFIGAHLCAALTARGDRLRVLDDLSTGHEAKLPRGTEFLRGDINRPADLAAALEGVDACFHLAAIASVERAVQDWPGTHRTNLSATIGLFDVARRRAIPVVYASSAAVYGQGDGQPLEEDAPRRPLSSYGADKLGCEQHARVAGLVHGVPSIGLRFFNVYGPGQDPASPYSGVISIFCDRLARGLPLDIFGDGRQTRDFIFVGDVVRALIAALPRANLAAPVVNVCTGTAVTIQGLAEMIAGINGMPLDIRRRAPRAGEIPHSVGSPARAQALLRLGTPVPLREGLRETFQATAQLPPGPRRAAPLNATASA
ncbi:MAG: NAD-dependent epimerase/dehydratase family protein [Roseococcus sp.]|nr:NAD-dependent epimerase/dehydratase family protein [Roseococcus sp.]